MTNEASAETTVPTVAVEQAIETQTPAEQPGVAEQQPTGRRRRAADGGCPLCGAPASALTVYTGENPLKVGTQFCDACGRRFAA